jgi:hypothetical protein
VYATGIGFIEPQLDNEFQEWQLHLSALRKHLSEAKAQPSICVSLWNNSALDKKKSILIIAGWCVSSRINCIGYSWLSTHYIDQQPNLKQQFKQINKQISQQHVKQTNKQVSKQHIKEINHQTTKQHVIQTINRISKQDTKNQQSNLKTTC